MSRRGMAATIAAFLMGWGLATTFQRAANRPLVPLALASAEAQQKDRMPPGGWSKPVPPREIPKGEAPPDAPPPPTLPEAPAAAEPPGFPEAPAMPPAPTQPEAAPTATTADPMEAVETFLRRNREEADRAIKALSTEADSLRERLAKVESALARWRSVADAIKPEATAPAPKGEPIFTPTDPTPEPAKPGAIVSSPNPDPIPTPAPKPDPAPPTRGNSEPALPKGPTGDVGPDPGTPPYPGSSPK